MPSQKITELAPAAAASDADRIVVVQGTTTPVTRRMTRGDFLAGVIPAAVTKERGSSPVVSGLAAGLTQTLATIAASWWVLRPESWPGTNLEFRFRAAVAGSVVVGDEIAIRPYSVTSSSYLIAEATGLVVAGPSVEVVTPWAAFPATQQHGYVQARNITAARGALHSITLDVRSI